MQSLEKVPRSLGEGRRGLGGMQMGSAGSGGSFKEGLGASMERGTAWAAKRGFAIPMLLWVTRMRRAR